VSTHSEWDLLAIAEDIEQGDVIDVEENDSNAVMQFIFVRIDKKKVVLRNKATKELVKFNSETLEDSHDLGLVILGKSDEE
jgi:hypothetical protein